MIQLVNILGAGIEGLPYEPDMMMGAYMRTVIAPALGLAVTSNTVPAHVQSYKLPQLVVFSEENCNARMADKIPDGTTLFYSLQPADVAGNAGKEPLTACAICLLKVAADPTKDHMLLCSHTFHAECLLKCDESHRSQWHTSNKRELRCPVCRKGITSADLSTCRWKKSMNLSF